ncbi:MAG: tRNA (adenosine(37)-N6)-dimethylallyltransferase MiaA [Acidimicrobiia bacterium]|nr:tRNA (adenosine(37)-N6)-dimethylallyltransferase MiaA [Acidimicrobiia bacterium]
MNASVRFRPNGRHLALVGPTASGKSSLALALACSRDDIEIVTVDSMQVYRGMDIGTAKPSAAQQAEVVHHLLDVCDPDDDYTVARFQRECLAVLAEIEARGKRALLVGGTGLYLQAITDDLEIPARFPAVRAQLETEPETTVLFGQLEQLDPVAASRMEPTNRRRVVRALEVTLGSGRPFSSFGPGLEDYPAAPFPIVGLAMERDLLDERISERYEQQMADGFLGEVKALLARPSGLGRTARQALGYTELLDHVEHGLPLNTALETAIQRTRRFARRQQRWFGRDPRINWLATDGTVSENLVAELARGLVD